MQRTDFAMLVGQGAVPLWAPAFARSATRRFASAALW